MKDEEYQSLPMTAADALAAYPLVYLYDASVTLDAWQEFVHRRMGSAGANSGLSVIRDRAKIVHALFAHRVDLDIKGERQLCLAQLIVAQIPGSQIDRAVAAAALTLAAELGCGSITVEEPFRLRPDAAPATLDGVLAYQHLDQQPGIR